MPSNESKTNAPNSLAKNLFTAGAYVWLLGGACYYFARFSRSFYTENEYAIHRAIERVFGS